MVDKSKRLWSVVCPFCGRSYRLSVWDMILRSQLRGILGFGQGVNDAGRYCKSDIAATDGAALDAALGAGFFSQLKDRMLNAVLNWLGNNWLTRDDLQGVLNKVGTVRDPEDGRSQAA